MSTATLLIYSRCPLELDAAGHRCNHPNVRTVKGEPVLLPQVEEMRHSIICQDDLGHCWDVVWSTDQPQT